MLDPECSRWLGGMRLQHISLSSKVRVVIAWLSDATAGLRAASDQRQALVAKCVSAV